MLEHQTILITGASRGIGRAIAERLAQAKAHVVVLSKDQPQNLEETASLIEPAGGLVLEVDVSDAGALEGAVSQVIERFGRIDALINNTSATCFTNTVETSPKQFDLMISTSVRAAFFLSQACLPSLKNAPNPHILNISPPLSFDRNCLSDYLAFSMSKYAMSLLTVGMAAEFHGLIGVNSLWPRTTIATQTIQDHFVPKTYGASRWPTIMADAAHEILNRSAKVCSGNFFIDEALLRSGGVTDFSHYAVDPEAPLFQALFTPKEKDLLQLTKEMFKS